LSEVKVGKDESLDAALRRFRRLCHARRQAFWLKPGGGNIMRSPA